MACQIPKSSTSKNMQLVDAALREMEVILTFDAESVNGLGFERLWRRNERIRDARATKPSC